MTGEIGQLALSAALTLAVLQAVFGVTGASRADVRMMAAASGAATGVFVLVALAFAALASAFVDSDFSVALVAANSHTAKPFLYKLTGVWGNHEGSMLLWVLVLAVYSAAMAFARRRSGALAARALGIQGIVAVFFLLFILFTSNPFLRIDPPPFEGRGLNPLLQDPGLAFHPPLLYAGYVGLSATFAFAVAALFSRGSAQEWARAMRPYALSAWIALTLGIALGSWWAYYELGWGGFWFWDPVENASLMPWLAATALLHSAMATERSGAFAGWTVLLAIAAFSLSLIGTFLVRSGVLTSVHAFASDPARGLFILAILVGVTGGALALYAWRGHSLGRGAGFASVSRESALLINNLLLCVAATVVFLGTLYPLLLDAVGGPKISVGPGYFAQTAVPIALLLLAAMPFGPMLAWRRGDGVAVLRHLRAAAVAGAVAGVLVLAVLEPRTVLGTAAVVLAVWLLAGTAADLARRGIAAGWRTLSTGVWAAAVAHMGVGVVALGAAGATVWKSEAGGALAPGESLAIAGYTLRFEGVEAVTGPNYLADRARLTLRDGGQVLAVLAPERRRYPAEGQATTEAAIRTDGFADLYAVLGDQRAAGRWAVRVFYNPLAPFIWAGSGIVALGGLIALAGRLRRRPNARQVGAHEALGTS